MTLDFVTSESFSDSLTQKAFKNAIARVTGLNVPDRVKGKAGEFREPWLTRDIDILVRKKGGITRFRQSGSSKTLNEHKKCRR